MSAILYKIWQKTSGYLLNGRLIGRLAALLDLVMCAKAKARSYENGSTGMVGRRGVRPKPYPFTIKDQVIDFMIWQAQQWIMDLDEGEDAKPCRSYLLAQPGCAYIDQAEHTHYTDCTSGEAYFRMPILWSRLVERNGGRCRILSVIKSLAPIDENIGSWDTGFIPIDKRKSTM